MNNTLTQPMAFAGMSSEFKEKVVKTNEVLKSYGRGKIFRPHAYDQLIEIGLSENMANRLLAVAAKQRAELSIIEPHFKRISHA